MRRALHLIVIAAGLWLPEPRTPFSRLSLDGDSATAEETPDGPLQIKLLVSMIWDGHSTAKVNTKVINEFRNHFSNIPFTHFVSPAYFADGNANIEQNKKDLLSVYRPHDQVGMNLAPWKSIATKAGVIFRNGPTFWGDSVSEAGCKTDCGQTVPLNIYTPSEIKKLTATSIDTLNAAGVGPIHGMHVSGWMASPDILAIGESQGITYDFSMITSSTIYNELRPFPLFTWVKNLWPQADIMSQPGVIAEDLPGLIEIPQSLGTLDYVTHKQMLSFLDRYISSHPKLPLTYQIVLHAETAHMTIPRLELVIQGMFQRANEKEFQLSMVELPEMAWYSNPTETPMVEAPKTEDRDHPQVH